jgi:hypothetical protein
MHAMVLAQACFFQGERHMRQTLLASATLLALACAVPALAQPYAPQPAAPDDTGGEHWAHQPGTGMSGPASNTSSNTGYVDSHSQIAPHLPEPIQGENASPETYLQDAQQALAQRKTGLAQQDLEMAETRLLDRSTAPEAARMPDQRPEIAAVSHARHALGAGDMRGASNDIQIALTSAPPRPEYAPPPPPQYAPPPPPGYAPRYAPPAQYAPAPPPGYAPPQ